MSLRYRHISFSAVLCFLVVLTVGAGELRAQSKSGDDGIAGEGRAPEVMNPDDTLFVFESPRPLLRSMLNTRSSPASYGGRIMISGSGYGAGFFYDRELSDHVSFFADLVISGARNTSELEMQDPITYAVFVPNKVNRVMIFPMNVGLNYHWTEESTIENMRPSVSAGIGPTYVLSAPYDPLHLDFFQSLSYAQTYLRWGGFVGAGLYVRNTEKSYVSIDARYYIIPFGGDGIESIRAKPMKDFNGLFLSLAIGFR